MRFLFPFFREGKSFLQKIRMTLARYPLFRDVRMIDAEIETVLARASKKMRKHWYNRGSEVVLDGTEGAVRFDIDGKYYQKWQDVLQRFKDELANVELNPEQREIYNAVVNPKKTARIRINDLNELEDVYLQHGTRKKRRI